MLISTIETFKRLYSEKQDVIDYMARFGNGFEQAEARIIKEIALNF